MSLTEKLLNTRPGWYVLHSLAGELAGGPAFVLAHFEAVWVYRLLLCLAGCWAALNAGAEHEHGDGDLYLKDAAGVEHLLTYVDPAGGRHWAVDGLKDVASYLALPLLTSMALLA